MWTFKRNFIFMLAAMDLAVTLGQQLSKPWQVKTFLQHPGLTCNNMYHHKSPCVVPSAVAHAWSAKTALSGLDARCVLIKSNLAECTGMLELMQLRVG